MPATWFKRPSSGLATIGVSLLCSLAATASDDFIRTAAPLFKQYCFDCHAGEKPEVDLDLEKLMAVPDFAGRFKQWRNVAEQVATGKMPPEDMPQPSAAERQALVALVRGELKKTAAKNAGDPGPVVIRRLTSAEYAYTVRDLTGLDLQLDRDFVSDAVGGEGFTNIGTVQFIEDATLERYLAAAKQIAAHTVVGAGPLTFFRDPG